MNWKSTVLVSGVGVVATWMASVTPPAPHATAPRDRPAATTGAADLSAEIVQEAERLTARLHPPVAYQEPARNPFRFEHARPAELSLAEPEPAAPPLGDMPRTQAPPVTLAGIAEDITESGVVRTAILSAPGDVLLVKEGDTVAGQYKVTAITATAVSLTRESDGFVVWLAIRP
jgi:hypothetical protein